MHSLSSLLRNVPPFWKLQIGGWLAFYVALVVPKAAWDGLTTALLKEGPTVVLGFLLTTALWPLWRRLFRRGVPTWQLLTYSAVAAYLGSFVWNLGYHVIYQGWLVPTFDFPARIIEKPGIFFFQSVYNAPLLFAWSLLYFGIKHHQALQLERERSLRAEASAHEARLQALRYQLNPHFLFNTLNAISTLVLERRTEEASTMLTRLSEFLRTTLEGSDGHQILLAEELEFARRYLEIEQVRFGERLRFRFEVEPEVLGVPVPAMILQPLVENAVRHGISPTKAGGLIEIAARLDGAALRLRVQDDGSGGREGADETGFGIGLANTRLRLAQVYGTAAKLELEARAGAGFTVHLLLPVADEELRPYAETADRQAAGAA
jgi:two-component system, LytTR family, sensor kinase